MGSSKNKSKKKDATKPRKMDTFHNKSDRKGHDCRDAAITSERNLINLFKSDELQELRKILKVKDLSNMPVLLGAIILCKFEMVKKFIQQGSKVNEIVFENLSALMWCVKMKNLKMIELLLSRGADVKVVDGNGDNILFSALNASIWDENTFMDFYNQIKKTNEIDINYANKTKCTILHCAVKRQWPTLVEALIEENVNMDVANVKGVTPLVFASLKNDKNILSILIKGGANVLFEDFRGCTSICYVIANICQKHREPPFEILEKLTTNFNMDEQYFYECYFKRRLELLINPPNNNSASYNYVINKLLNPIIKFFKKYLPFGIDVFLTCDIFGKFKEGMEKHIKSAEYIQATLSSMGLVLQWCSCRVHAMNNEPGEFELIDKFFDSGTGNLCLRIASVYKDSMNFKQILPLCVTPIVLVCGTENASARTWLKNCLIEVQQFYEKFMDLCGIDTINDTQHEEMMKQKINKFKEIYDELQFQKQNEILVIEPEVSKTMVEYSEFPNSGKKTSKRVRRKARARIAKIRSADMAERCKNNASNVSLPLDQNANLIQEQDDTVQAIAKLYPHETLIERKSYSFCVEIIEIKPVDPNNTDSTESFEAHNDISTSTIVHEENHILHLQNNLRSINSTTSYGTNDSGVIISEDLLNIDVIDVNIKSLIENNSIANKRDEFTANIVQLKGMYKAIVDKYLHFWEIEDCLNHPEFIGAYGKKLHPLTRGNRDQQIQFIKAYLAQLEQACINKLFDNFLKTIDRIEELFYMNDDSYLYLIERLKYALSTHKIRNQHVFTRHEGHEINEEHVQNDGENIHEPVCRPTYLELIENIVPKKGELMSNNSHNSDENLMQVYQAGVMQIFVKKDNDCNLPYRKRKLQDGETNIVQAKSGENAKIYKWGTLIENLKQYFKNSIRKGSVTECPVIACPPETRSRYILATAGNFGNVELALAQNGTPLALKRIPYENSNASRMIMTCVEQLLELKHDNLLRYVSCDQDGKGDLCLTTPLYDFNLGEYLMLMKMDNVTYKHYYSFVSINYIVNQLLSGLQYLHEQDPPIIHGNLKPSNVFVTSKGQLCLAEFGIHGILYQKETAPKSSQIWFARETYENYDRFSTMDCTKYSDIQVAGMLVHFALTKGLHPFGVVANDILHNLVKGLPDIRTPREDMNDLLRWMLARKVSNRPSIRKVQNHMCFWSPMKKWSFVLLCCGLGETGMPLIDHNKDELHSSLDHLSAHFGFDGNWGPRMRLLYSDVLIPDEISLTSMSGLLTFIRSCYALKQSSIQDEMIRKFFMVAIPNLPLSLFRLVANSFWRHSTMFMEYFQ